MCERENCAHAHTLRRLRIVVCLGKYARVNGIGVTPREVGLLPRVYHPCTRCSDPTIPPHQRGNTKGLEVVGLVSPRPPARTSLPGKQLNSGHTLAVCRLDQLVYNDGLVRLLAHALCQHNRGWHRRPRCTRHHVADDGNGTRRHRDAPPFHGHNQRLRAGTRVHARPVKGRTRVHVPLRVQDNHGGALEARLEQKVGGLLQLRKRHPQIQNCIIKCERLANVARKRCQPCVIDGVVEFRYTSVDVRAAITPRRISQSQCEACALIRQTAERPIRHIACPCRVH